MLCLARWLCPRFTDLFLQGVFVLLLTLSFSWFYSISSVSPRCVSICLSLSLSRVVHSLRNNFAKQYRCLFEEYYKVTTLLQEVNNCSLSLHTETLPLMKRDIADTCLCEVWRHSNATKTCAWWWTEPSFTFSTCAACYKLYRTWLSEYLEAMVKKMLKCIQQSRLTALTISS